MRVYFSPSLRNRPDLVDLVSLLGEIASVVGEIRVLPDTTGAKKIICLSGEEDQYRAGEVPIDVFHPSKDIGRYIAAALACTPAERR